MGLINKYLLIYQTSCAEYEQANHGCQTVTHEIDILQEQCEGTDIVVIDGHFLMTINHNYIWTVFLMLRLLHVLAYIQDIIRQRLKNMYYKQYYRLSDNYLY